jgi:hypothetical protein
MKKKFILFLIITSLLICPSFAGTTPDMKEGLWEITVTSKMEMPGMSMPMPPQKYTQCITKKDFVPKDSQEEEKCEQVDVKAEGDTVSWTINCTTKEGTTKGTGKITYKGDTYEGVMNMTFSNNDGSSGNMTNTMNGRWIGNCN